MSGSWQTQHVSYRLVALLAGVVITGCTSVTAPESTMVVATTVPAPTVEIPESRLSPFCQSMAELSAKLDDPDVDASAVILETYRSVRDEVPAEIRDDFEAVLNSLGSDTTETDNDDSVAPNAPPQAGGDAVSEEYLQPDTPAGRLNAYIEQTCWGIDNNPGPPGTAPNN